jgi:hypothetical protein
MKGVSACLCDERLFYGCWFVDAIIFKPEMIKKETKADVDANCFGYILVINLF